VSGPAIARVGAELRAQPRRWLVTGAAGFIGSHLAERLLGLGQDVRGLDDLSSGTRARLAAATGAAGEGAHWEFVHGDVRDAQALAQAIEGCEFVLHQAALGSVARSFREPAPYVEVNVLGTARVLAAAERAGVRRVVLASSSSVYGDRLESPQREERTGAPLSPYAASKQAAELVLAGHVRARSLSGVALRYFNVFGPRQDPHGPYAAVIPRWAAAIREGRAARLEGDGRQTRDFTPVAAVVEANLLAALAPLASPFEVFNVGTGRETSLLALHGELRALAAELGLPAPLEPERQPPRPLDRRASRADLTRARAVLEYEPPGELRNTLRAVLLERSAT
jgi:UDP-N-acetylglucosamine 4-epimerase